MQHHFALWPPRVDLGGLCTFLIIGKMKQLFSDIIVSPLSTFASEGSDRLPSDSASARVCVPSFCLVSAHPQWSGGRVWGLFLSLNLRYVCSQEGPHETSGNVWQGWKVKGLRRWCLGCSSPRPACLGCHLCLALFSFSPSFLLFYQWLLGLSLLSPPLKPISPPSVFLLSGDLVPSHQSIHFSLAPPGSFWRCFHLIISLKKFFSRAVQGHRSHQCCFLTQWPFNQAEVHFATGLCRPPFLPGAQGWSQWPQSYESHSCQSFRGGIGDLHQFTGI